MNDKTTDCVFAVTFAQLCGFYAVPADERPTCDADAGVTIYRDHEGWHVGGDEAEGLTDDEWAPRNDEQAFALRAEAL